MATEIYEIKKAYLVDDTKLILTPLKIKYLREVMKKFSEIRKLQNDSEVVAGVMECVLLAMQQYCPSIETIEELEDAIDLPTAYSVLEVGAGIKLGKNEDGDEMETPDQIAERASSQGSSWDDLDLAKLESEVFLLGIWKDYNELEESLSMPELLETLKSKRDSDYQDKKFFAAIQGVDLDKNSGGDEWEKLKARVFSKGKTDNPNDITTFTGSKAAQAGFGIGNGLSYERVE